MGSGWDAQMGDGTVTVHRYMKQLFPGKTEWTVNNFDADAIAARYSDDDASVRLLSTGYDYDATRDMWRETRTYNIAAGV